MEEDLDNKYLAMAMDLYNHIQNTIEQPKDAVVALLYTTALMYAFNSIALLDDDFYKSHTETLKILVNILNEIQELDS